MKRVVLVSLATVAALLIPLLFLDLRIALTAADKESVQSMGRAQAGHELIGRELIGPELTVYLAGDPALARELKRALPEALRSKELPFEAVRFVDEVPPDARKNPFLSLIMATDGGFWTPFYATRSMKGTFYYAQGSHIQKEEVLAPDPEVVAVAFTEGTCWGQCTQGRRTVKLGVTAKGLISLPALRSYIAEQIAQEAAILVADGLPDQMNPAKWMDRAGTLARERLGPQPGGSFSTFEPLAGCPGGIVLIGGLSPGQDWVVMYYDASGDSITDMVTRKQVQAKLQGAALPDSPGLIGGDDGVSVYLGVGNSVLFPAGSCSLAAWEVRNR